jgi:hypothetical protein
MSFSPSLQIRLLWSDQSNEEAMEPIVRENGIVFTEKLQQMEDEVEEL